MTRFSQAVTVRQRLPIGYFNATSIDLYVTQRCNQTCSFCFHSDDYFDAGLEMSTGEAISRIDWAILNGVTDVAFLGGEPTLYRPLIDLLSYARSQGLSTRLVTNGLGPYRRLLDDEGGHALLDGVHLSIDGLRPSHDCVRGDGAFERALSSARLTVDAGIALTINVAVSQRNIGDVPQVCDLGFQIGASRVNLHWMSPIGRGGTADAPLPVEAVQWLELVDWVRSLPVDPLTIKVDCQNPFVERNETCVVSDRTNLQFFPDGSVFACGLMVSDHPSAYLFARGAVWLRHGPSELEVVNKKNCVGCPARPAQGADALVPGCIYPRVSSSES